jgi:uncharacterized membrane protein
MARRAPTRRHDLVQGCSRPSSGNHLDNEQPGGTLMPDALGPGRVGPVDIAVIAFDGDKFDSGLAPTLAGLQANGIVRFIDLAFVTKDSRGQTQVVELADDEVTASYRQIADPQFDVVKEADLESLASELPPESSALVVVWENAWAADFAAAVSESNGRVMAFERIPFETVRRAFEALEE